MRKILNDRIALLLVLIPFLMGMGGLKERKPPAEIPIPNISFMAAVTDGSGAVTELTQVSIDGRTFIVGRRGKATITIDFDNIEEVTFDSSGQKLMASIIIRGGVKEQIYTDPASRCFGKTGYGTYQIDAKDIRVLKLKGIQKQ